MLIHLNLLSEVCTCVTMGRRNKSGDDRGGGAQTVIAGPRIKSEDVPATY